MTKKRSPRYQRQKGRHALSHIERQMIDAALTRLERTLAQLARTLGRPARS